MPGPPNRTRLLGAPFWALASQTRIFYPGLRSGVPGAPGTRLPGGGWSQKHEAVAPSGGGGGRRTGICVALGVCQALFFVCSHCMCTGPHLILTTAL